jgi:hypothetical protein
METAMPRRQITSEERSEALRRGHEEGARRFPGRAVSVQVDEMTDEHGNVIYKIRPAAEGQ